MSADERNAKKEEIRDRTSLREIISRHVALKPQGRNFVGLCPFHAEKSPSFSVSDEKGFFYCFGCGEKGDVFEFMMKVEGLTFPETLERLAGELGIELPQSGGGDPHQKEERELLLRISASTNEFYQRCLWETKAAEVAREHLAQREITEETAKAFGIGYSPREGLARYLANRDLSLDLADKLGLTAIGNSGQRYDRFRHRLMFPIANTGGAVVAFGGRALSAEDKAKYINSPETPLFHKSRMLFGLDRARDAIRGKSRVLVVEGYLDAIALAQAGIHEVVAPLGTALTSEQGRLLRRFTETIVVLFDGDAAGAKAAARAFPVLAEVGIFADGAFLPEGEDPDTFVRSQGVAALEELLAKRQPLIDHWLASLAPSGASLPQVQRAAEAVRDLLGRLGDPIFAGMVATRASSRLGLGIDELRTRGRRPRQPSHEPALEEFPPSAEPPEPPMSEEEALLLELLLVLPELQGKAPVDLATRLRTTAAKRTLDEVRGSGENPTAVLDQLPPKSRDRASRALLSDEVRREIYAQPEQMLADCLARLDAIPVVDRRRELAAQIREAETRGDTAELQRLLAESRELATRARAT